MYFLLSGFLIGLGILEGIITYLGYYSKLPIEWKYFNSVWGVYESLLFATCYLLVAYLSIRQGLQEK